MRTDGRTDRHDEANSHFSHMKAPNKTEYLNPKPNIKYSNLNFSQVI